MLKVLIKRILPAATWSALRGLKQNIVFRADRVGAYCGRKALLSARLLLQPRNQGMTIGMLCIRRPVYVKLAIDSINSLHYHNSAHKVLLHVDAICLSAFNQTRRRLDYPRMVETVLIEDPPAQPWPWTKIDLVLDLAKRGIPFVDADSRWHCDPAPLLAGDEPMFLVVVNRFEENEMEKRLIELLLKRPDWASLLHYNSGFVYFPPGSYSEAFGRLARELSRRIPGAKELPVVGEEIFNATARVCEEIALGIAAQEVLGTERIRTLKDLDGPGDRRILQSFYYGCVNGIV